MINARAETVATMPAFRDAFKARRGLILATGFYEWARQECWALEPSGSGHAPS
jgi:putative SOS response-associated peptidase YedK